MKTKLVTLLLLFFCLSAMADDPRTHLVIWAKDGSKIVYPLMSKPKITFTDFDLVVNTNGLEAVFNIENTSHFTYENSTDKCVLVLNNSMATYCSPLDLDISSVSELKAYVASSFDSEVGILTMTRVNEIPAGAGVLLIGEKGTYEIPFSVFHSSYDNLLKGVTIATEISPTEGEYTNYILANGTHGTGFYRLSTSGLLDAGKAYLQLPTSVVKSRMSIKINYDGNTTGISEVDPQTLENNYFRFDGIRMMNPFRKGIYLKNGKQIIVK